MSMLAPISLASAAAFAAIVVLLHFLRPELDPSWRMISEYEDGRWGVLMRLAFICLSASCLALAAILWRHVWAFADALFILAGSGPLIAAVFAPDAIMAPRSAKTAAGGWHAVGGTLFILGFPVAVSLITASAGGPLFAPLRSWLPWLSAVVWLGFLAFLAAAAMYRTADVGSLAMKIGWPNRFLAFTYVAWIVVVAGTLWRA